MMTSHPVRSLLVFGTLLVLMAWMPERAAAQEPAVETLVPGRRSVTFRALSGSSSFGVWRMRDERTNLGLMIDGSIDYDRQAEDGDDNDASVLRITVGAGPEVRRYADISGRVAPYGFVGGRLGLRWERHSNEPADAVNQWSANLGGSVGLGAEFFPVRSFSLNVQTGLTSSLGYSPIDRPDPLPDGSLFSFDLATFSTSIGGAIYF